MNNHVYQQSKLTPPPPTNVPLNNIKNTTVNGQNYTIVKSKDKGDLVVENIGNHNTKKEVDEALKNIQQNQTERDKFNRLSKQDQEQYLIKLVVNKYKITHNLTGIQDQKKENPNLVNSATINLAQNDENDVKLNSELGIIKDTHDGTITTIEQRPDNTLTITETNSIGNSELITPTESQYNDITKNSNQPQENTISQDNNNTYLSENGIENPQNQNINNFSTGFALGATAALTHPYVKSRVRRLQPNRINNSNNGNAAFITTKMIIILMGSIPTALFIGLIIGTILGWK